MRFVASMLAAMGLFAVFAGAAEPDAAPATKPVVAPPTTNVAPAAEIGAKMREAEEKRIAAMDVSATYKAADVLQFIDKDGELRVNWTGPEIAGPKRVEFEGSKAMWVISRAGTVEQAALPKALYLVLMSRYDFTHGADGGPWLETLNLAPTYTHISATFGPGITTCSLTWKHGNGPFRFSLTSLTDGQHKMLLTESSWNFGQFRANHPDEVRKYVVPVLRDLTGVDWLTPGPGDVYRVFDKIAPDPKVVQKLAGVLSRLDSEVFAEREKAAGELAALGRPGVLAALRQDASALSPEQKRWLDAFVAQHSRRTIDDLATTRKDAYFLLDSLEDEDPAVRSAAREALETATGRKITLDVSQPAGKLTGAVDALRREVAAAAATQPTSQPQLDDETRREMLKPAN